MQTASLLRNQTVEAKAGSESELWVRSQKQTKSWIICQKMRSRSLSFILNITVFMFHPLFTADNTDMIIIHLCSRQQQSERRLQQIQTSRLFPDQQTISIPQLSVCPSVRGQTATTHDHSCISTHTHTHTHTHSAWSTDQSEESIMTQKQKPVPEIWAPLLQNKNWWHSNVEMWNLLNWSGVRLKSCSCHDDTFTLS